MKQPVKCKIGRWFESGYGLGLEVDTERTDPDLRWRTVGHVETVGKRKPYYRLRSGGEGGGYMGESRDFEDAKRQLLRAAGVTVVVEE
jgi:hypothetical protein